MSPSTQTRKPNSDPRESRNPSLWRRVASSITVNLFKSEERYFHVAVNVATTHSCLSLFSLLLPSISFSLYTYISLSLSLSLSLCMYEYTQRECTVGYICVVKLFIGLSVRSRYPFPPFHACKASMHVMHLVYTERNRPVLRH